MKLLPPIGHRIKIKPRSKGQTLLATGIPHSKPVTKRRDENLHLPTQVLTYLTILPVCVPSWQRKPSLLSRHKKAYCAKTPKRGTL